MKLSHFVRLARSSFFLDWTMLRTAGIKDKLSFLFHKYTLLALPWLYKDRAKNMYVIPMWGASIFLPTPRDISAIQSNVIAHAYLKRYIGKNATIIDIGAHIGQFNIFCRSHLHAASIFSFEPIQSSYAVLALNATTQTYHAAVSNKEHIVMHIPSSTQLATIFPESSHHAQEKVSCIAIDSITEIQQLKHVDLMKIDVEGMEYEVLETCAKTLQKTKYLLVEISLERQQSTTSLTTLSFIQQHMPQAELIHIGGIYPHAGCAKQEAVDMLFYNPHA